MESPEINTIFEKGDQNAKCKWGKDSLFNKSARKIGCKIIIGSVSYTTHKNNLKWIKDRNIWPETVEFQVENIGEKLHNIGLANDFINMKPKTHATKAKLDKWDYI